MGVVLREGEWQSLYTALAHDWAEKRALTVLAAGAPAASSSSSAVIVPAPMPSRPSTMARQVWPDMPTNVEQCHDEINKLRGELELARTQNLQLVLENGREIRDKKKAQRMASYYKDVVGDARDSATRDDNTDFVGTTCTMFSVEGGMKAACGRNQAGALGADRCLTLLGIDKEGRSLIHWEHLASAALIGRSRAFHKTMIETLEELALSSLLANGDGFAAVAVQLGGDATNSDVHKHEKCQNLRTRTEYWAAEKFNAVAYPQREIFDEQVRMNEIWADWQVVSEGTGLACYSMVIKQMTGVGSFHWEQKVSKLLREVLHVAWSYPADDGPDQRYAKGIINKKYNEHI